jgi:hypothetical protein
MARVVAMESRRGRRTLQVVEADMFAPGRGGRVVSPFIVPKIGSVALLPSVADLSKQVLHSGGRPTL